MKIGIGLPNQVRDVDPTVIPTWAARAERAGFSSVGTIGRIAYPGVIDTVALAAAAGATSTIGLISNIMVATVWPGTLLAKELAGIDGVSGGRLTVGIGVGGRPDDFVVDGLGPKGLGKRIDKDLEAYRALWTGQPVGGGDNPGVPAGTREVPMLLGGTAPVSFTRMAKWGRGYIAGGVPAAYAAGLFDQARAAWREAGREGDPRLVAIGYFALGDPDRGRTNLRDYYAFADDYAEQVATGMSDSAEALRAVVASFSDLGTDEFIFNPGTDDLDEIERLAEIVL
ncbi:LLM class flavin-dependent oxidoreductase [Kutzneria kofuensis]|uniref:Alkanesulfonate monooxygenase SsuD/methylene tetrahydromethanopterin reductase-like flavin-dependent oxidoreductase (Luciferase family) n=1 Tax=Kutzneria kofuensis TaxID=103725 RepID=A0A7W9KDF7_9PSEU|nr:LLM class flavin-dependent oxidoreductase [Kutzneria kofuensis]MBB5889774.1 alkanesulfonate monooxygenase SsuD/methylene tetrahydromethanopterin reductase-like flavin-dependent oxidoreductase (luciferase family) [Kutzneria kofuensis]